MITWLENHLLPCQLKAILGIDCPLCGTQRSFIQLLKGDFAGSFSIYPPLIFVLIYLVILALYLSKVKWINRKRLDISSITLLSIIFINYGIKIISGNISS